MSDTSITYHLPMSAVRISGTRTTTHDACLTTQDPPKTEASTALVVVADPAAISEVQLHQGWFRQTQANLALTEDGRLSSASSESQGEVGTLVKAVVSTAATVFGTFTRRTLMAVEAEEPNDQAQAIYRAQHEVEADLIELYGTTVVAMEQGLAAHLKGLSSRVPTKEQLAEVHRLEIALSDARAQLDRLELHYRVWRAAQKTSIVEKHSYDVPITEAGKVTVTFDGRVTVPPDCPESRKAWEALGVVVEVRSAPRPTGRTSLAPFAGVHVRMPRPVQIRTWRRRDTDPARAELVSSETRLVVDASSDLSWFGFTSSVWAKRKTAVTMTALGGLATYEYSGDSVGAAIAKTLSDVPGDVATGLDQADTIGSDLTKLRSAQAEEALARTKRRHDQLQAQLSLDGLAATEHSYAELERLKQQKDLLETGNAVSSLQHPSAPSDLAGLQHDVDLLKLQRELAALRART